MDNFFKNWLKPAAALYALGFLVHNIYLSKFNIYEYDLIEAKYIFSGGTFLVYSVILFFVVSLKTNLSRLRESFFVLDDLLPWILRLTSFPYVLYGFLHGNDFFNPNVNKAFSFEWVLFFSYNFGHFFFWLTALDLFAQLTKGLSIPAKLLRSLIRINALPMLFMSILIATVNQEYKGLLLSIFFFFFGFLGMAIAQEDELVGIKTRLLHKNSGMNLEATYSFLFGVLCIGYIVFALMTNYVKYVYPYLPTAFGGSKPVLAQIETKNRVLIVNIIQESKSWIIVTNKNKIEKIKASSVERIVYQ